MKYSWFGAVWRTEGSSQLVDGFWFGDQKNKILKQVNKAGFNNWKETATNSIEIQNIYNSIRKSQKEQDWKKVSLLSLKTAYTWRNTTSGWYLIRSNPNYPFYISAIKKNSCFIWLMHTDICENAADIQKFMEKVNEKHQIQLKSQF
ncbi:hypothetical protein EHS13_07045 [Paenibacillus psychroresistens]|uniref:Uncharacterized protein n=1 Tax=Paenibacillus psychroresistens TaxID=1778678 RepID=A0A6B8RDY9_9BACL|nr:hypothetical protein [Paenibacillus psychroresistens]QGQ94661.1 hypothetical protein EHS13_07045 [Paenibacillus psychroresistens]